MRPMRVVCCQNRDAIQAHRGVRVEVGKGEDQRVLCGPALRTSQRRGVRPGELFHPLHVSFMGPIVRIGNQASLEKGLRDASRHVGVQEQGAVARVGRQGPQLRRDVG